MVSKKTLTICICSVAICLMSWLSACKKTCQTGYENPNCSVEIRAQFENLYYTATESRNLDSPYTYNPTIIADPHDIRRILLTGIANGQFINNVSALTNSDTMTIAYQCPDTNAHYIQGSGILSGNVLTMSYAVTYPDSYPVLHTQTDYYQSVWTHP